MSLVSLIALISFLSVGAMAGVLDVDFTDWHVQQLPETGTPYCHIRLEQHADNNFHQIHFAMPWRIDIVLPDLKGRTWHPNSIEGHISSDTWKDVELRPNATLSLNIWVNMSMPVSPGLRKTLARSKDKAGTIRRYAQKFSRPQTREEMKWYLAGQAMQRCVFVNSNGLGASQFQDGFTLLALHVKIHLSTVLDMLGVEPEVSMPIVMVCKPGEDLAVMAAV